jgi:cyclic pyranopterin phosphate synthase
MVVLRGLNEAQIWEMLDFARAAGFVLQLIEVESATAEDGYYKEYHRDLSEIEAQLSRRAEKVIVRDMQDRKRLFLRGGGEVELVRPMHNTSFCGNCTRLRVTSNGKLKPCLFRSDNLVDIVAAVRRDASDEELGELFRCAVALRRPYFT